MWLLDESGALRRADLAELPIIDGASPPDVVPDAHALVIAFGAMADGRGFSTARRLRTLGFAGQLYASGPLIPDQAREAFQCGFSGVIVSDDALTRHGKNAWANAVITAPATLYAAPSAGWGLAIWVARHAGR